MSRRRTSLIALVLAAAVAGPAHAKDELPAGPGTFSSVSADVAILFDGPSERANRRYVVVRGTPLQIVSELGRWRKVRELDGEVLWADAGSLGAPRHVIVSRALVSVRRTPSEVGELLFQAERGMLFEVVDGAAPAGWLKVRDATGGEGFVAAVDVWGRGGRGSPSGAANP